MLPLLIGGQNMVPVSRKSVVPSCRSLQSLRENVKLVEPTQGCYLSIAYPLLRMLTTRDRMGKSPAALYRQLWPNTILSGDRLPELRPIVRRIAYVTWNAVGNGGYEPDGYAFLHGTARWMDCGARIVEITPELIKAVLRTGIRGIEDVTGNDFRLPSVMFVMPKGTLRSTVRGDCSNLLASISMPTASGNRVRQLWAERYLEFPLSSDESWRLASYEFFRESFEKRLLEEHDTALDLRPDRDEDPESPEYKARLK
jgi:hypothetical protein